MSTYQVTHWVNFNEYLMTHEIKSNTLTMIDDRTIKLDGDIEIVFSERIQMIVNTEYKVIIFEDDDY